MTIRVFTAVLAMAFLMFLLAPSWAENFRVMRYNDEYPPLCFSNNGELVGTTVDVLNAVCVITGDTYTFVSAPFPRAQMLFDDGKIDLEASVCPAWREHNKVRGVYTIPYTDSVNVMVFRSRDTFMGVREDLDLKGKSVGIVRGYCYPAYDPLFEEGVIERVEDRTSTRLLEQLVNGRVDLIFVHKPFVEYMMKVHPKYAGFKIGKVVSSREIMMRFHPSKAKAVERFNSALKHLKESGELAKIYARYRKLGK